MVIPAGYASEWMNLGRVPIKSGLSSLMRLTIYMPLSQQPLSKWLEAV